MKKSYKPNNRRRGGNFKYRNKRRYNKNSSHFSKTFIKHDKYISKAVETKEESPYVEHANFSNLNLDPIVLNNIKARNYTKPTKVQHQAIPEVLNKKDVLCMASTGSGKTAAFLLPIISNIMQDRSQKCLVVVPTRELANQIYTEFRSFSIDTGVYAALIVGGTKYASQLKALQRDPAFIIATPGRLLDFYKTNKIKLSKFNNVVLDEVDEMLDMGFVRDIKLIVSKLSQNKQCMFFSATMNSKAEDIAKSFLKDPVRIQISKESASMNVEQNILKYEFVGEKVNILHEILETTQYGKFLVFSKTRRGADSLAKELNRRGHSSDVLHGNKSQHQRNKVLGKFRNSDINILVATDVASRGIDIPNITHIINYDEPATYKDYIHRIGRTGRIGNKGIALTFVR